MDVRVLNIRYEVENITTGITFGEAEPRVPTIFLYAETERTPAFSFANRTLARVGPGFHDSQLPYSTIISFVVRDS